MPIDPIFAMNNYLTWRNEIGCAIKMLNLVRGQWRSLKVTKGHTLMIKVGKNQELKFLSNIFILPPSVT